MAQAQDILIRRSSRLANKQIKSTPPKITKSKSSKPKIQKPVTKKAVDQRTAKPESIAISNPRKRKRKSPDDDRPAALAVAPKHESAIEHWQRTGFWPKRLFTPGKGMASKRLRTNSGEPNPVTQSDEDQARPRELTSKSSYSSLVKKGQAPLQYTRQWADAARHHGIILDFEDVRWHEEDQKLLDTLLARPDADPDLPLYSGSRLRQLLNRVQNRNEARIVRDIQPLLMPSAENLAITTFPSLSKLAEEVDQQWTKVSTLYGPPPQPDFAVGFLAASFSDSEFEKMKFFSTTDQPTMVTELMIYPFALCESKSADGRLDTASRQNAHSAAIIIRAMIALYRAAKQDIKDLHERICVISLNHNHNQAQIYAHYPRVQGEGVTYHQRLFASVHPDLATTEDRWVCYNIMCKVYTEFAPMVLERIKGALAKIELSDIASHVSTDISVSEVVAKEGSAAQDGLMLPPPSPVLAKMAADSARLEQTNQELTARLALMEAKFDQLMEQRVMDQRFNKLTEQQRTTT